MLRGDKEDERAKWSEGERFRGEAQNEYRVKVFVDDHKWKERERERVQKRTRRKGRRSGRGSAMKVYCRGYVRRFAQFRCI